ncbi:MAG: YciK family oxidoreductase [Gammaproteobacteria bacterium]|nr:YciK family oxidoreductase [Gammaproteobacteria bacterium]
MPELNPSDYQAPKHSLNEKVILVTGASDGIGKAAAIEFAKHGATIILLGRSVPKLETVYDEIENLGYNKPAIYPLDLAVAAEHDYQELANILHREFGKLDGLLHNASILGDLTPIEQYPVDTWNKVMQVNMDSAFMLTQATLPLLHNADLASLVFTSSGVGRKGRAYWGAYSVSKFAIEGFMQVLAEELENTSKVRVNCINPGATRTAMRSAAFPAENPEDLRRPDEILAAYLYLMGNDSFKINGQSIDAQPLPS